MGKWMGKKGLAAMVAAGGIMFGAATGWCGFASLDEALPAHASRGEIVSHLAYTLKYNERHEQAEWVVYRLTAEQLKQNLPRKDNFREDPRVKTGSATPEDYRRSGYDRGHLAPAADMKWSKQAMSESFFMSNMSPQEPDFNQGIWNTLEERVRDWAREYGELYIVTGPILEDGLPVIGENGVSAPRAYYKIVLDYREPGFKAAGFLMPNAGSDRPIDAYVVTVDSVESVTGIDFFPALPDSLEHALESGLRPAEWGLSGPERLAAAQPRMEAAPRAGASADTSAKLAPAVETEPGRGEGRRLTIRHYIAAAVALVIVVIVVWLLFVIIGEAAGLFRRK